ncbi:hypothetical protein TNCV_4879941 [Trichonephila clavipes]|nr:hypothetical protein TNCV_4879941 [Trichonephila clavipes]
MFDLNCVISNPRGAEKSTPSPFDLPAKECHKTDLAHQTTVPGMRPSSPEDKQGRAGTGIERLNPLHKGHTTQVTASKARHGLLKSLGSPSL